MTRAAPGPLPTDFLDGVLRSLRAGVMSFSAVRGGDATILDFRWTYVNQAAEALVGRTSAQLIGACLTEVMPGNRAEGLFDRYVRVVETGEPAEFVVDYRHEGIEASFDVRAVKYDDGFVVSFVDISNERRNRRQVEALSQRLELATRAGGMAVYDMDLLTGRIHCNNRMFEMYGLPPRPDGIMSEAEWEQRVHPDDLAHANAVVAARMETGGECSCDFRIRLDDGTLRNIRTFATVMLDEAGRPVRMVGVDLDVTEETLRMENVVRYKEAIEAARDGILFTGTAADDFAIQYVNPAFETLTGFSAAEAIGHNCRFLQGGERDQPGLDDIRAALREERPVFAQLRNRRKDGTPFWQELSITPLRDAAGRVTAHIGIQHDITERVLQQMELEDHAAMLRAVGDIQSSYIIGDVDPRLLFARVLDAFVQTTASAFGFIGEVMREEDGTPYLRTSAISDISWNEETRTFFESRSRTGLEFRNLDTLFGQVVRTGETVLTNSPSTDPRSHGLPPGHPELTSFLGVPLYSGPRFVGMVGLANRPGGYDRKVVDRLQPMIATAAGLIAAEQVEQRRRAAERELIDAKQRAEEANEAKSRFVAVMSHELRTPLNAIIGFAEIMREQLYGPLGDSRYRDYAGDILASGRHLLGLINDILDVSRLDSHVVQTRLETVDPVELVEDGLRGLEHLFQQRELVLHRDLPRASTPCRLDRRILHQILLNLMSNALKFSRPGGTVRVALTQERDWLRLVVEDGGAGFPAEVLHRVGTPFLQVDDPFRRDHGGAGLGLSIVKRLSELHGGGLVIANRPEGGARAAVTLRLGA